jgi:hypothetical protein
MQIFWSVTAIVLLFAMMVIPKDRYLSRAARHHIDLPAAAVGNRTTAHAN